MYWSEDEVKPVYRIPDDIVDLLFKIKCPLLPVDHAYALSQAVLKVLPWLADIEHAGIHLIHGAATGNGWQRPGDTDEQIMHLSRRTRFIMRLPNDRITAARALSGKILDIDNYAMEIGDAHTRLLSTQTTLFARHVVAQADDSEDQFVEQSVGQLQQMGINIKKLLCGKLHTMQTANETLFMRSLMLADLEREHSMLLQQQGLGPERKMGCGVFIPHKSVAAVNAKTEDY